MGVFFSILLSVAVGLAVLGSFVAGIFLHDWKSAGFGIVACIVLVIIDRAVISQESRNKAMGLLSDVGFALKLLFLVGGGILIGGAIGYSILSWFGILAGGLIGGAIGFGVLLNSD